MNKGNCFKGRVSLGSAKYNNMKLSNIVAIIPIIFLLLLFSQCQPVAQPTDQVVAKAQSSIPQTTTTRGRTPDPVTVINKSDEITIQLFEKAAPSVVYITTTQGYQNSWSRNIEEIPAGTGSGFLWDDNGHIVTNYHVIKDAYKARVTLFNQQTFEAKLVGAEPSKDLAVLKIIPPEGIDPIPIGTSHDLKVGQSVFAIGNPFGLDQTLTTGIISALGREIESVAKIPIRDVIQTDAAINPGNSGGPLLDISGRVIGVNTAIYSPSGAYAGIGFSVPIDIVNWVVPDLIEFGKVERPTLGIEIARQYLVDRLDKEGVLVVSVIPGSAADKAGIQAVSQNAAGDFELGDLIVEINDEPVKKNTDLFLTLEKYKPGNRINVKVERKGKIVSLPVILDASR